MTERRKLIKVRPPLPGAGLISFGPPRKLDEKTAPRHLRFDGGMHAKREWEKPSHERTRVDFGGQTIDQEALKRVRGY